MFCVKLYSLTLGRNNHHTFKTVSTYALSKIYS